jgi:hypothetical protein
MMTNNPRGVAMPSPFPGMNPYLENPELWTEVHHLLIGILAEVLNPQLLPHYRAAIEKRVYQMNGENALLIGIPDVTVEGSRSALKPEPRQPTSTITVAPPPIAPVSVTVPMPVEFREGYLEIREVATREVITVVEVLSPTNKRSGKGRNAYEEKRQEVLASQTHLVEIDLLRTGEPMPFSGGIERHYRILVSRGDRRPRAELYAFNLQDKIPVFPLPLKAYDAEPMIDLHHVLDIAYDRAGYDVVIDYNQEPTQPLPDLVMAWADQFLRQIGLRTV